MALVVVETFTNRGGRFTSRVQDLRWTAAMQNHGRRRRPTKLLPSLEVIQVAASSICRCPTPSTFLDSLDSTQKCKKSGANLLNLPHAIRKKTMKLVQPVCIFYFLVHGCVLVWRSRTGKFASGVWFVCRLFLGCASFCVSHLESGKTKWRVCFGVCFATVELPSLNKKYYKPTHCCAVRAPCPASWMCSSVNCRAASALHLVGLVASLKSFVEIYAKDT